ncbi:YdcF family protein [Emticicia sp. ODNR4P]|nr:YdcF family protein [Emticicia sp. ODNR4P]
MLPEEKIYNYLNKCCAPQHPDFILVLGSSDLRVPKFAAEYFLENPVSNIVVSGGLGKITNEIWTETEAHTFSKVMIDLGVPAEKIYLEEKASNTGENILFSKKIIEQHGLPHREGLLIAKPYMTRRAYNTASQQWPEVKWSTSAEPLTYHEYLDLVDDKETFIHLIVGDLQRIKVYGQLGFQITEQVPADVWEAYEELVDKGYNRFVINKT